RSDPRSPEENLKSFPNPYDCGSAGSARKSLEKKEPDVPGYFGNSTVLLKLHVVVVGRRLVLLSTSRHRGALAYFRENNPRESMVALGQKIEADLGRKGSLLALRMEAGPAGGNDQAGRDVRDAAVAGASTIAIATLHAPSRSSNSLKNTTHDATALERVAHIRVQLTNSHLGIAPIGHKSSRNKRNAPFRARALRDVFRRLPPLFPATLFMFAAPLIRKKNAPGPSLVALLAASADVVVADVRKSSRLTYSPSVELK
ncbi:hypothetical protein B0H11DRAFT_1932556, partial [Mycena galericulata]